MLVGYSNLYSNTNLEDQTEMQQVAVARDMNVQNMRLKFSRIKPTGNRPIVLTTIRTPSSKTVGDVFEVC